jgi:hypothetical protein
MSNYIRYLRQQKYSAHLLNEIVLRKKKLHILKPSTIDQVFNEKSFKVQACVVILQKINMCEWFLNIEFLFS